MSTTHLCPGQQPLLRVAAAALACCVMLTARAAAHQVPSLTVEALFSADRSYILRLNLDPRLFLSDQPASLPPVPIEWYREQNAAEREATRQKAADYLQRALTLRFGEQTKPVGQCEFQPMDGATNMPLVEDTKEVHLLATAKGKVPDGVTSFAVALSQDATVSMILMNSFEGTMERRPNVIFPGETTRPYELPIPPPAASKPAIGMPPDTEAAPAGLAEANGQGPASPAAKTKSQSTIAALIAVTALLLMAARRARARRHESAGPTTNGRE